MFIPQIEATKVKGRNITEKIVRTFIISLILVESKDPKEVLKEVDKGIYDKVISEGKETIDKEKLDKLATDFKEVQKAQENLIKEMEKKEEEKAAPPTPKAETTEEKKEEEKK